MSCVIWLERVAVVCWIVVVDEVKKIPFSSLVPILVATAEDSDSPVAMKLKKMWLKTPVSEEQAAQAVLDPAIGNY